MGSGSPAAPHRCFSGHAMKLTKLLVFAGVVGGAATVAVSGWAFFTASGTGQGAAAVGNFGPPTSVTVTVPSATVRTVHVAWTAPATPDGSALDGYTLARSDGTTTTAACGTGTTPLAGTATSCDDTSVASGTYTYTVTAQWKSWSATSSASGSATIAAATLHHFTVVPSTSTPTAGTQFSVTITAIDQYSGTMTAYTGSQCVTFSGPGTSPAPASTTPTYPAGGAGCTGGNSLVTFAGGVGSPNVTLAKAESPTLAVTDVTTSKTGSASLTVAAAGINRLLVSPSTSTPTAGTSFTAPLTAHDLYDNLAISYTGSQTIIWSALSTSPAPSSTAPSYPGTGVTFSAGASTTTLTFTAFSAGANTLTATDAGGKTGSASLTVSPLAINRLVVTPSTSTPTAGTSFTATLSAHDLYDNVATSYPASQTITWSALGTSPAPSNQAPSYPTSTVSFTAGASTTTLTAIAYAGGANTLTATDAGSKTGSASLTVSAATATKLAITTQPGGGTGGTAWTTQPVVKVQDTYSNVATTNTSNVTFAITTNPSTGTLSGTTTVAASAGIATFTNLAIDKAGNGYILTATDGALTSAASSGFNITVGAAAKLAFTTQPGGGTGGTA
ncbi:MAG: Peptidase families and domain protein, partial [Acidimicrobiales bacterium]|nr:Peptidase families and domain protein [Acidimicrobiales bacterium]